MMERLMEDGFRYGEPVYTQCSEEMIALSEELRKQLDREASDLLDRLEDVFVKRETASVEGAFREGFCRAALLALDVLAYQAGLPED